MMARKLIKMDKYVGEIELLSGLAINGSGNDLHIGGADTEVIKNPITQMPYIPGSSLKGKMRSLLELKYGKWTQGRMGEPCGCGKKDCFICTIFGAYNNPRAESAPTRIIVRDCNLTKESEDLINNLPLDSGSYLEEKTENIIDRKQGIAGSPRTKERVPAGLSFSMEIVLQIFDEDNEQALKGYINEALELLQNSYLGNSGSRGYGQVKIEGDWQ